MPELPEVETVARGLALVLSGRCILRADIRRFDLRTPVPRDLADHLQQVRVHAVRRRAKVLLIDVDGGTLLNHLGMTGTWRIGTVERTHDHAALHLNDGRCLVFHDPRRFGQLDWIPAGSSHPTLDTLGLEPLDAAFTGPWLHAALARRSGAIKPAIMDQALVVGVGNIYAQEALFRAGMHPQQRSNSLSAKRCARLVEAIRTVLAEAIAAGGTTISDFRQAGGESGYFQTRLAVYGKAGQACGVCQNTLLGGAIGGRGTTWCPRCQR
jgi:formamidopyrimidine-DNA glycosylase